MTIDQNLLPPEGLTGEIFTEDGIALRYALWPAEEEPGKEPRGTVAIVSGRAECIEKYSETIGDLRRRGFTVAIFDWRGQGLSQRLVRGRGHVGHFRDYRKDLEAFERKVLVPHCPKPWFALAHSMGAALLLDQAQDVGSPFDRLILCAPMIALKCLPFPRSMRFLTHILSAVGLGRAIIPLRSARAATTMPFARNLLTSDPVRFERFLAVLKATPELTTGIPTFGWLKAALDLMHHLNQPDFGLDIVTPALIFALADDQIVDARAIERFASSLKNGRCLVIPNAQHEILLEQDCYREQFWAAFDAFTLGASESVLQQPERPLIVETIETGSQRKTGENDEGYSLQPLS